MSQYSPQTRRIYCNIRFREQYIYCNILVDAIYGSPRLAGSHHISHSSLSLSLSSVQPRPPVWLSLENRPTKDSDTADELENSTT